jgi:hypothetical protein
MHFTSQKKKKEKSDLFLVVRKLTKAVLEFGVK